MKKIFFLVFVQLLIQSTFASSQNSDNRVRENLNQFLFLIDSQNNELVEAQIISLADSLYNDLESVSDIKLSNEIRINVASALLRFDGGKIFKPVRVENLLRLISSTQKDHLYDNLLAKNSYFLHDKHGWNPPRVFEGLNTSDEISLAINYKFYNEQGVDNDFVSKVLNYLERDQIMTKVVKESYLIKICSLVKKDSSIIAGSLQNQAYLALSNNIANPNVKYLDQFISLKKVSLKKQQNSDVEPNLKPLQVSGSLWAGIEVGSSGVKLSIIQFVGNENNVITFRTVCEPQTISNPMGDVDINKCTTIANSVRKFYDCIFTDYPEFSRYPERIVIAYSSGFCNDFISDNKVKYLDSLDIVIKRFLKINKQSITHLSASEESSYTFLGLVQNKNLRDQSVVIDIGNGNTKGGFFTTGSTKNKRVSNSDFVSVDFTLASGSLKKIIDKQIGFDADVEKYNSAIDNYLSYTKEKEISQKVSSPGISNKQYVYFSGGISWVISTIKEPFNYTFKPIEITEVDVNKFINSLLTDYNRLVITAQDNYGKFMENKKNANNVLLNNCLSCNGYEFIFDKFNQKLCLAGAKVLLETMRSIRANGFNGKRFFVATSGKLSWTNGFIANTLD